MNTTKNILKWVTIIGLYSLLIIPFLYSKELYFPYITTKAFLFRGIIEIILGTWVGLAILDPKYRPKKSYLLWSFVSLIVVMLVANFQGTDVAKSMWSNYERMDGFINLLHVFGLFLVAGAMFTTSKAWSWFWHTSIVFSLGHAAVAILQYTGQLSASFAQDRVDAFFGNAIYLAVFMLFHAFITLFYLLRKKHSNVYVPYVYIVALLLQVVTVVLTATRGTMIGLGGGMLVTFLIIALFSKQQKSLRMVSGGIIVALVLFAGVIIGAKDSSFVQNIPAFKRLASISITDSTTFARFVNWNIAWEASQERPLLGYGQGNYGPIYDAGYDPRLWNQEQWFDRSHNVLLDWLVAGGWFGLLAYLSLFVVAVLLIGKKDSTYSITEKAVLIGLLAGYFVHNIFVFDNLTSYMMFALVLAFLHSQNSATLFSDNVSKRKPEVLLTFAAVAVFAGIALVPIVNAQAYKQNTILIKNLGGKADNVEMLLEQFKSGAEIQSYGLTEYRQQALVFTSNNILRSSAVSTEVKKQYLEFVLQELSLEIDAHPGSARTLFIAAQFLAQIGDYENAKDIIEQAIALSPKKQILYQMYSEILVRLDEDEKAIEVAKMSYELETGNVDAWSQYVRILSRVGKTEEANALIEASYTENNGENILALLQRELQLDPSNPQAYASLGTAYVKVGNIEKAIETFTLLGDTIPEAKEQADKTIVQLQTTGTLE